MPIDWHDNAAGTVAAQAAIAAIPNSGAQTSATVATALNGQTEPDDGAAPAGEIRTAALETRFTRAGGANTRSLWGTLQAMSVRVWSEGTQAADHAKNDVICAAASFLSIFRELEETGAPLIRNNALWSSMDKDLEILSNTTAAGASLNLPATSGSPIMTKAQADWVRLQGDRTRPKWYPSPLSADDVNWLMGRPSGTP